MSNPILDVKNLTKIFGQFKAVDDISFSINEGQIIGLLGPNGAGKTTTIQMLLDLITPTSGTIRIFNKEFRTQREEILQQMNFSSSYTHLPWRLTVWENLYFVALLYSLKEPREKIEKILKIMDLESVRNKTVEDLSSGWINRLNMARTFLNDPRLILLDEPTASLDPDAAKNLRDRILTLRDEQKTTILWTSHNMAEVEEVCDRVIILKNGQIIAQDTPENLARRIKICHINVMIIKGWNKLKSESEKNKWRMSTKERFTTLELSEKELPQLLSILSRNDIEYEEISIEKPTLEDYFLAIAGN